MRLKGIIEMLPGWLKPRRMRYIGFTLFGIWGGLSSMYSGDYLIWLAVVAACILAFSYIAEPKRHR